MTGYERLTFLAQNDLRVLTPMPYWNGVKTLDRIGKLLSQSDIPMKKGFQHMLEPLEFVGSGGRI